MKITPLLFFASTLAAGFITPLWAVPATFTTTISGQGQPIIFLPGLACPGAVWDATVAQFGNDYQCHVVSIAGFGGTPGTASDQPLLASVREELFSYVRDRRLEKPIVIGHSLGGFLALDLAARHPDLPGALVVVESLPFLMGVTLPNASLEHARQAAEATASAFAKMTPEAYGQMIRTGPNGSTMAASPLDLDRIVSWGLASDRGTVAKAMTEMYVSDLRAEVASIKCPSLVLAAWVGYSPYSSHDSIARVYTEQYAKLDGARIQISDTARHFIMLDEPAWMLSQIRTFLKSVQRNVVTKSR